MTVLWKIFLLTAFGAASARADISDSGNMTLGGNAVISGSMTVTGPIALSTSGASVYALTSSTGINVVNGPIVLGGGAFVQWADGTTSTTAASGGGAVVVPGISSSCAAGYYLSTMTVTNGIVTGGGCVAAGGSSSGNMSTTGQNTMASGSAITYGSGALNALVAGSTSTSYSGSLTSIKGGANFWIMASSSSVFGTSTVTLSLSNALQPWEVNASSINWRVDYVLTSTCSSSLYPLMGFNGSWPATKYVSYINWNTTGSGASAGSAYYAWILSANSPIPSGGEAKGYMDFETVWGSSVVVRGDGELNMSDSAITNLRGNILKLRESLSAPPSSIQIILSTVNGSVFPNEGCGVYGQFELWRKGYQHK